MKRTDTPLDAALGVYEGDAQDTVFETILKIAGKLYLPIGMITAFREHFSTLERQKRILEVLRVFKSELESLQGESAQDAARTKTIEERLQSPKFMEAVLTAAEEAARTGDIRKLDRLACVLTNGLDPQAKVSDDEDLPSFVRDASQLTEMDIQVLNLIHSTFIDVIAVTPNLHDPNVFTERAVELLKNVDKARIHRDDFYAARAKARCTPQKTYLSPPRSDSPTRRTMTW